MAAQASSGCAPLHLSRVALCDGEHPREAESEGRVSVAADSLSNPLNKTLLQLKVAESAFLLCFQVAPGLRQWYKRQRHFFVAFARISMKVIREWHDLRLLNPITLNSYSPSRCFLCKLKANAVLEQQQLLPPSRRSQHCVMSSCYASAFRVS